MNLIPNHPNPSLTLEVNGQYFFIVTKDVIEEFIFLKEQSRRSENSTKVCTKKSALEILGCSETTFYRMLKRPGCKIRRAAARGKYVLSSIHAELQK